MWSWLRWPPIFPDEKDSVLRMLQKMHATSRNLLFGSDDTAALQAAFDPKWESAVPYTVLIAPDGKVLYQKQGDVDISGITQDNLGWSAVGLHWLQ